MLELLLAGELSSEYLLDYPPDEEVGAIGVNDKGTLKLNLTRINGSTAAVVNHETFGKAIRFYGTGGLKTVASTLPINNGFTLSFNYYAFSISGQVLVTHVTWNSGGSSFGIQHLSDGRLQVYINGGQRIWSAALSINTAYSIKLTKVGNVFTLYVNDTSAGTATITGFNAVALPLCFGSATEGLANCNGMIKNIRLSAP